MELAFFVVDLGMSLSDYRSLTEAEKLFIKKRSEQKFIHDTTWHRNATLNAEANINRGKNKKFIDLFPKNNKADFEYNNKAIETVLEMDATQGKSWVDRIFQANGMQLTNNKERSN
ncbi:hypothetical protein ACUW9Z_001035 [Aerococcus sp. 150760007-1]|uniref:Phenylalanine racemase n=1 Tax=Aerococcus urinaeequi TaxID=51665 RepID=A0ABR5ZY67_9LACT|nr:phenylalanine racemase [Aerococcus urinaeequi]MBA5746697.1 phenylalanine racemase [Aerococcus urinaeequi]MBA5829508.1 phenylalanine racemase [Aerococcus urinaeequi]MBA5860385.1 phenylalanine racemase [Aerococcus urinaeequi]